MKAALLEGPSRLRIADVPAPVPNDYQSLVRMELCGVCSGTDTKLFEGKKPFSIQYPSLLGHESVGRVVQVGKRVRRYAVGDRVLRACAIYPGQTVQGLGSVWGSFAEFGLVTDVATWRQEQPGSECDKFGYARLQLKVPGDLAVLEACLLITWKEIYSALKLLGGLQGKSVAIVGDGGVGLSFCQWARVFGCEAITVFGRRDFRLDRARKLGASRTWNTHRDKLPDSRSFDVVVDTIGSAQVIQQMLPLLREGGRIGVYGVGETFEVDFDRSLGPRTWSFVQINPDEAACHDEALALVRKHGFRAADFVTRIEPLENLELSFQHLRDPQSIKAVIRFQES
jgi:threonine dehydrogenase-like Zn-dependent dehydrogenase